MSQLSLQKLADELDVSVEHGDTLIDSIAPLHTGQAGQLSFYTTPKHHSALLNTKATAVLIKAEHVADSPVPAIVVPDPLLAFSILGKHFDRTPSYAPGVHATAVIGEDCQLADSVYIGPHVVLGHGVQLGEHVCIEAGCVIGDRVQLGEQSRLRPRVTLYHDVCIGARVMIHAGAVIGSDGFGNVRTAEGWQKVPQLGAVTINDDVEIGANSTIDRGALTDTQIGQGVKVDNLVQVAHNVVIGDRTAIAAGTGIAGSTQIGKDCLIGGNAGVNGHISVCDGVVITGMTMVTKTITKPGMYSSGRGLLENKQWRRNAARFRQLDKWIKQLQQLLQSTINSEGK